MLRRELSLRCPECDASNPVPKRELAVGRAWRCPACGAGLYLDRVWDRPDPDPPWQLVSGEPPDDDRSRG